VTTRGPAHRPSVVDRAFALYAVARENERAGDMGGRDAGNQNVTALYAPGTTSDVPEHNVVGLEERTDKSIDHDPVATAWSIHSSIAEWTRSVDNKASFASAVETAVLLGVLTLSANERQLAGLQGTWQLGLFWLGIAFLILSLLLVLWVISPHLRSKRVGEEYRSNVIYFGHARFWKPSELTTVLSGGDILPMLSRQIVAISNIAWKKHRNLQLSILGSVIGTALVAIAAWTSALAS
jgi:hypothetical protein